tara:strand:+ start:134 stop:241 length:108 start_codon:yes stop_codon:yes gene_type:complete
MNINSFFNEFKKSLKEAFFLVTFENIINDNPARRI